MPTLYVQWWTSYFPTLSIDYHYINFSAPELAVPYSTACAFFWGATQNTTNPTPTFVTGDYASAVEFFTGAAVNFLVNNINSDAGKTVFSALYYDLEQVDPPTLAALTNYVPSVRTVNSKPLNANVVLNQDDIGAGSTNGVYTLAEKSKLAAITGTNTGDQTSVSGNAGTATKLATARTINGVNFDGSANITISAATPMTISPLTLTPSAPGTTTGANTGTQISSSKPSSVKVSYSTQVSVTLGGSPISTVILKTCATNDVNEANWVEAGRTESSQPTTLTVTVGGVYKSTGQICADVPAGYYVKAVNSGTGTHSEAFVSGQQTIYG